MKRGWTDILFAVGLVAALGVPTALVVGKEQVLADGRLVLLPLVPVDPRSLMQGDYMVLRYEAARGIDVSGWPADGRIVVEVDDEAVAAFLRRDDGTGLDPREVALRYRIRKGQLRLGAEAYFFQEGHGEYYQGARYGGVRVDDDGDLVLAGLYDEARRLMTSPPPQ